MENQSKKIEFPPLDDLYNLLSQLEKLFSTTIEDKHFKIGRQQIFFTFFHELMHAFITNKAEWIHELDDEEVDFVDEVVVRVLIDFIIEEFSLAGKINPYYEKYIHHEYDLKSYGYELSPDSYHSIESEWYKVFRDELDINGFCKYVLLYYRKNFTKVRDTEYVDKIVSKGETSHKSKRKF